MTVIDDLIDQAERHAADATRWGNTNHGSHFALGIAVIVVGLAAGVMGAFGAASPVTGAVGLLAGAIGAVQSFASPEDRAQWHYSHVGEYEAIANDARVLRDRTGGVDEMEIRTLNERLRDLRTRKFQRGSSQDGSN